MPTITETTSGTFRARVRIKGYPSTSRTFWRRRDASDWARRIEDEMVRGVYRLGKQAGHPAKKAKGRVGAMSFRMRKLRPERPIVPAQRPKAHDRRIRPVIDDAGHTIRSIKKTASLSWSSNFLEPR